MKDYFAVDLQAAEAKETQAVKAFEALKPAKEEEMEIGKQFVVQMDEELAAVGGKEAQAFKEIEDTEAQLALDGTLLANLKEKCTVTDEECAKRVRDRLDEIDAVEDTIKILYTDAAFDAFEKTVLLQTPGGATAEEQMARQRCVADCLTQTVRSTAAGPLL